MILRHNGYFVIPKRINRKLSSRIRPDGNTVQEQMRSLQETGLGKLVKVDKTVFFYKAIPTTVEAEKLAAFKISIEQNREAFQLLDESLTDVQQGAAEVNHPDWDSYKRFCKSNNLNAQYKSLLYI